MTDNVYLRLREFLDNLPGGYPSTESGVETRLLKRLFSPEQAEIELQLTTTPESPSTIAPRLNMDEKEAAEKLEAMAKEGLILRIRAGDDPFYAAVSFIVGIFEFQLNRIDREYAEMFEEYLPYLAKSWESTKTKQMRVLPIGSSLNRGQSVASYDQVREVVNTKELIGVATCICTKEQDALDNSCAHPTERCIMFDFGVQYYVDNGMGRRIG